jgi:hypothetical protein
LFALDQPLGQGVGVRSHRLQPRRCGAAYHAAMPELAFLDVGGASGELATALAEEVNRQDAVGVVCDEPLAEAADRVHVVFLDSADSPFDTVPELSRSIVVLLEPPSTDHFLESVALARWAGAAFHVNAAAVIDLQAGDLQARHLPLGYVGDWDRFDPEAEPDLTIVGADHGYFDWFGALRPMHSGSVVLHERSRGMAPLVAGRHLFVGDGGSLDTLADALRRDPERLDRIRHQAIDYLCGSMPLGRAAGVLIGAARGVVGRPLSTR